MIPETPVRLVRGRPLRAGAGGVLAPGDPVTLTLAHDRDGVEIGDDAAILCPALVDAHVHLLATAAARAALDLAHPPACDLATLLARLRDAHRSLPPGAWLRAAGFDEAWLAEGRPPTPAEIDGACPGRAVRLRHATRHASVLSSAALERLRAALGPLGDHLAGPGFVVGLEPEISRVVGPIAGDAMQRGLAALGAEMRACGIVAVDEVTASNDAERVRLLADAVEGGVLPLSLRVWVGAASELAPARHAARGRVAIGGVKLLARDEAEVRSSAWARCVVDARRAGARLAIHAVEPDVIHAVLDVLAGVPSRATHPIDTGFGTGPDRIEHASLCPPQTVAALGRSGVTVCVQPAFLVERAAKYRRELEVPLHAWLQPLRSLRRAGVRLIAGSDSPVVSIDPASGLRGAVARAAAGEPALGGSAEGLSEADALALFTGRRSRPKDLLVLDRWDGVLGWPGPAGILASVRGGSVRDLAGDPSCAAADRGDGSLGR